NGNGATIEPAAGAPMMSMLTIADGLAVSISQVTMTRGNGGTSAQNLESGAAIFELGAGTLTVTHSAFTDNKANFAGGAISSGGTVRLTEDTFTSNSIRFSVGGAVDAATL